MSRKSDDRFSERDMHQGENKERVPVPSKRDAPGHDAENRAVVFGRYHAPQTRERAMQMHHGQTSSNALSPEMAQGCEFAGLILKLRWIGLDDEANELQRVAQTFAPEQRPIVLNEPASTD